MDVALTNGPCLNESECPVSHGELRRYLAVEAYGHPEAKAGIELHYARHARLSNVDYWLWFFTDDEGDECFAIVSGKAGRFGRTVMSTGSPSWNASMHS